MKYAFTSRNRAPRIRSPAGGPEKGGTATAARDGQAGNREASVDAAISAVLQIQSLVSDARRSGSRNP
jgi:hypothetical protein